MGVTLGTGVTTDIIVAAKDGTDPDGVYRWKWNGSAWPQPEASTLETTDSFVALEKRAPSGATYMGFVTFDAGAGTGDIYFSRVHLSDTQTTFTVAANSDDATEGYNTSGPVPGYMWLNGQYDRNRATTDPTLIRDDGVRFANITVPAGATITGAWFEALFYATATDDIDCTIYANAVDSASTFTTTTFDITSGRARTTAGIPWQKDGLAGAGSSWSGLHVLEPVQEVVQQVRLGKRQCPRPALHPKPEPVGEKNAIWSPRVHRQRILRVDLTYTILGVDASASHIRPDHGPVARRRHPEQRQPVPLSAHQRSAKRAPRSARSSSSSQGSRAYTPTTSPTSASTTALRTLPPAARRASRVRRAPSRSPAGCFRPAPLPGITRWSPTSAHSSRTRRSRSRWARATSPSTGSLPGKRKHPEQCDAHR